jgi:hypothetical protein
MTRSVSELWVSATAKKNSQTIYERLNQALGASSEAEIGADNPVIHDIPASGGESVQAPVKGYRNVSIPALASLPAPRLAFTKTPVDHTQASPRALGTLMHHFLEHWLRYQRWHSGAELAQVINLQGIALEPAVSLLERCQTMLQVLQFNQLVQQADYLAIEQTLVYEGKQLRPDVVAYQTDSDAAWVIDFKLSFSPEHEFASEYAEQLSGYANAVQAAGIEQVGCFIVDLKGCFWGLSHGQWEVCQVPWHV